MMSEYKDTFKGTARYYVKYRNRYPEELFTHLRDRFTLTKKDSVLDLGCGPGLLAIPLSRYVEQVVGMDPEPEMLEAAKEQVAINGVENIRWLLGRSDDLPGLPDELRHFKLVTMGRAFHWMNGEQTLRDITGILTGSGGVAIIWDSSSWRTWGSPEQEPVKDIVNRYLGERRRAGSDYYYPRKERFEDIVRGSCLKNMETWKTTWTQQSTIDEIIGYYFSTSMANPHILGDSREAFESDLREVLTTTYPSGNVTSEVSTEAILAWK